MTGVQAREPWTPPATLDGQPMRAAATARRRSPDHRKVHRRRSSRAKAPTHEGDAEFANRLQCERTPIRAERETER